MKKHIVIFASGSGTNAENIIRYFQKGTFAEVSMVLSNKASALVLQRAENLGVPSKWFGRDSFNDHQGVLKLLKELKPDLIVLAGFLWKFPEHIINAFPNKVINVHPALLPKYGGKGMYGRYVHESVVANGETETGITIHFVNEAYDEGAIIFQAKTAVSPDDTPDSVAHKVHQLEYEHFPQVIESLLKRGR